MSVPYKLTVFNEVFDKKRSEEKNVLQSMLLSSYHMMLISSPPTFSEGEDDIKAICLSIFFIAVIQLLINSISSSFLHPHPTQLNLFFIFLFLDISENFPFFSSTSLLNICTLCLLHSHNWLFFSFETSRSRWQISETERTGWIKSSYRAPGEHSWTRNGDC